MKQLMLSKKKPLKLLKRVQNMLKYLVKKLHQLPKLVMNIWHMVLILSKNMPRKIRLAYTDYDIFLIYIQRIC